MTIAVLGTGSVGRTLAARLVELGHSVVVGTRDPRATLTRTEGDRSAAYSTWQAEHPAVGLATFADAVRAADLVVNALPGGATVAALEQAGTDNLAGKVLIDIANPLDLSAGFPPSLLVKDTDSLGEQVEPAFPQTRVVKSLNTLTAALMVEPAALGESSSVFVSGDDAEAKRTVTELLVSFGHDDVIDLGGIETARGTEMFMPLWLRLMGSLGTGSFNVKIVR